MLAPVGNSLILPSTGDYLVTAVVGLTSVVSQAVGCNLVDSTAATTADTQSSNVTASGAQLTLLGAGSDAAGDVLQVQCEAPFILADATSVRIAAVEVGSLNGS